MPVPIAFGPALPTNDDLGQIFAKLTPDLIKTTASSARAAGYIGPH